MNAPANIRVNTQVPFPSLVQGSGPVTIAKRNGIWTVGFSIATIGIGAPPVADYASDYVLVYDSVAGTYFRMSLSALVAAGAGNSYRIVTAAGDVTVLPGDQSILMNKTVGAATAINMPTSASRSGVPLTVKDLKGDANTNNITFVPSGVETIDGLSPAAAITAGIALIDTNYGKRTLYPLTSGGWYS